MPTITRISRKELTAAEIADAVENGERVIIDVSVLSKTISLVIRKQDGTYYCDTPMKLMTHESRDELRQCLEQFRLVKREQTDETDVSPVAA